MKFFMFYFLNPGNTKKKCFAGRLRKNTERKREFFWDGKHPIRKTVKEKFEDNMDAIRTLQKMERENRMADENEQKILAGYTGWGGLADVFKSSNRNYAVLKAALDRVEYEAARSTVTDAFYTDPRIASYMYDMLKRFGFRKGNILEPSAGSGVFLSVMDDITEINKYAVEADPLTGRILAQLHQKCRVYRKGFEKTTFEDNFFDAVIGNVPFGDFKVNDVRYNRHHFKIHDYFIAKSLDLVRPGGIVILITSKGTMDKKSNTARKQYAKKAVLLGAVRLPNTAFRDIAGTEATTDILVFQKKEVPSEEPAEWVEVSLDPDGMAVNSYFLKHPEMILGTMKSDTRYGDGKFTYCDNPDFTVKDVKKALGRITGSMEFSDPAEQNKRRECIPAVPGIKNFTYYVSDSRKIYYRKNSLMYPVRLSVKDGARIMALDGIRKTLRDLIHVMKTGTDDEVESLQEVLNTQYDRFVGRYGYIVKNKVFRNDADYPMCCALEVMDPETKQVSRADIFRKRTIRRPETITHTESAVDALNMSLNKYGTIDLDYMAELDRDDGESTGQAKQRMIKELKGLIFLNPERYCPDDPYSGWEPADAYLSGNVRKKLETAGKASEKYPDFFAGNVKALESVQPEDVEAADIDVQIGTPWISIEDYEEFLYELLGTPDEIQGGQTGIRIECDPSSLTYRIISKNLHNRSIAATESYGTKRMDAYSIFEYTLNLKTVTVKDRIDDGDGKYHYVVNKDATILAREKQQKIRDKFREWIFVDGERRRKYVKYYNDTFNSTRLREYDGSFLKFPGMNPEIILKDYQKNAIARILFGGNTLLAHSVGAGKSFEMIGAIMEMRRLGFANKPVLVVPKSLIGQMAGEFLRLYPCADILVATEYDFSKERRKQFISRIATTDFDCVIMSQTQFEKIPMSPEKRKSYMDEEIRTLTVMIDRMREETGKRSWTVKQMESAKKRLQQKMEVLLEEHRKDDVVCFDDLGIDAMFIDEAHSYKNCAIYSKINNVAGISSAAAKKAADMQMKCHYINKISKGRGIVFATGTPVSNTICEMYVMQQYLQEDRLKELGLNYFDAWAATFGEVTTALELTVEGNGYRFKSRFNRFKNLPELMNIFREIADIRLAKDLDLDIPSLRGGKYIICESHPDEHTKKMMKEIVKRAERIHAGAVNPSEDNFLKITNDARLLGTDARLLDADAPENPGGKLADVRDHVLAEYRRAQEAGIIGTQLIFSDIGTPNQKRKFTVYGYLKDSLVKAGIPSAEIAFIHDAKTDEARKKLFQYVRKGKIRILIGSTDKCGTGVNVPDHVIALHHVDCPWKPSCIEQREGRALRQGNRNSEVAVYRYVTKGTFDAYSWNLIENKQRFISQIMTSKVVVRYCEDVDEAVLSYAEIKAVATGNPLIREKMELDNDVCKLRLLKSSHDNRKWRLEDRLHVQYPRMIRRETQKLERYQKEVTLRNRNTTDGFSINILGETYTDRKVAGKAFAKAIEHVSTQKMIGMYRGFEILWKKDAFLDHILILKGCYSYNLEGSLTGYVNLDRIERFLGCFEKRSVRYRVVLRTARRIWNRPEQNWSVHSGKRKN